VLQVQCQRRVHCTLYTLHTLYTVLYVLYVHRGPVLWKVDTPVLQVLLELGQCRRRRNPGDACGPFVLQMEARGDSCDHSCSDTCNDACG